MKEEEIQDAILAFLQKRGYGLPTSYEAIREIWRKSRLHDETKAALMRVNPDDTVNDSVTFYGDIVGCLKKKPRGRLRQWF